MNEPQTNSEVSRFIVIFNARSGSTWLTDTLNSHPDVLCLGEKFSPAYIPKGSRQLVELQNFYKQPTTKLALGCKLKAGDIVKPVWFGELVRELDLKIVSLGRRNPVRRTISYLRGEELQRRTGQWNANKKSAEPLGSMTIDPEAFATRLSLVKEGDERLRYVVNETRLPYLDLFYEDLEQDLTCELARVCQFIGIDETQLMTTSIRKNTVGRLIDIVPNLDELSAAFCGTELEWAFGD